MLVEIKNTKQRENECLRRWFNCSTMDLIVWFDEKENIFEFQLSYNKPHNEHALNWNYHWMQKSSKNMWVNIKWKQQLL